MSTDHDLVLRLGREELSIRRRYETLSILNDLVSGLLFLVGSVLFFTPSTTYAGTWLFVIGSLCLLFRPSIRLTRRVHLTRRGSRAQAHESSMDF